MAKAEMRCRRELTISKQDLFEIIAKSFGLPEPDHGIGGAALFDMELGSDDLTVTYHTEMSYDG